MISFTKSNKILSMQRPSLKLNTTNAIKKRKRRVEIGEERRISLERNTVDYLTFDEMRLIYEKNTWIRACVDKIVTRLSLIPPEIVPIATPDNDASNPSDQQMRHIEKLADLIINPNSSRESFSSIRQKLDRDMLVYDAGCLEIVRDELGMPVEIYAAHSPSFVLNTDKSGNFINFNKCYFEKSDIQSSGHDYDDQDRGFTNIFMTDSEKKNSSHLSGVWYGIDELIYMVMNPRSGTPYGTSKIETLAKTVVNATRVENYNSALFGNDATPRLAVLFNNVSLERLQEYQKFWDNNLRGKPHRPILISTGEGEGSVKIEKVGLAPSEMSFKQYSQWMLEQIMSVFNMQPLVLGMVTPNTGKLNSEQQQEQFEKDALIPQLSTFAYHLNSELIWSLPNPKIGHKGGFGYRDVYLDWGLEKSLDEQEQWDLDRQQLMEGVLTINYVRKHRFGLPEVEWGDVPLKMTLKGSKIGSNGLELPNPGLPTGLEELEDSDLTDAIAASLSERDAMFKSYSLPKEETENRLDNLEDKIDDIQLSINQIASTSQES